MSRTRNQGSEVSEPILAYVATGGHPWPSQSDALLIGQSRPSRLLRFLRGGRRERTHVVHEVPKLVGRHAVTLGWHTAMAALNAVE